MGKTRGNSKDLWEGWRRSTSSFQDLTSLTNLSFYLSFSPSLSILLFLLEDLPFVRISCPLWALTPIRAYLQETDGVVGHSLAPPNCWKRHIESPPPHRGPPGNLPPLARRPLGTHTHTHLTQGANLPWFTCFISHSKSVCFLCFEGGWVTQCYALLHRGGGSALSQTASQGTGEEDSTKRMTPANALQSNNGS